MNTTLTCKVVTTRKPHRCFCCRRVFPKGTDMQYWSNVCDGDFGSGYNCATCEELLQIAYKNFDDGEGYQEGCVDESLDKDQTPEALLQIERIRAQIKKERINV